MTVRNGCVTEPLQDGRGITSVNPRTPGSVLLDDSPAPRTLQPHAATGHAVVVPSVVAWVGPRVVRDIPVTSGSLSSIRTAPGHSDDLDEDRILVMMSEYIAAHSRPASYRALTTASKAPPLQAIEYLYNSLSEAGVVFVHFSI